MFNKKLLSKVGNVVNIFGSLEDCQRENFCACTDSRKYKTGEAFFALKGPNFDGFGFIDSVIKLKCELIIFESSETSGEKAKEVILDYPHLVLIEVKSVLNFLQGLSKIRLEDWRRNKTVIGITGSNGKTTNKELLLGILQKVFPEKVCSTKGNLNNHIGVPLTLLSVNDEDEVLIVEMGTNHPGEIKFLCDLVNPDTGFITNIGSSHLEFFKSEEGVFEEKISLYESITQRGKGCFIANLDDFYLSRLESCLPKYKGLYFFSNTKEADFSYSLKKNEISLEVGGNLYKIKNQFLFGDYNFRNLFSCLLLAYLNYPHKIKLLMTAACEVRLPQNNRSSWIKKNGKEVFLDAYNANPSSMKAAISAFYQKIKEENRSMTDVTLVLGDMNELGDLSEKAHQELGQMVLDYEFKNVIYLGKWSQYFLKGFQTKWVYENVEQLRNDPPQKLLDAKFILIKASRSLQLETLVDIV